MSVTSEKDVKKGGMGETVKVIVQALLLALVVRTFLFQPFNIPSGSMIPTLEVGDYLFVSKYAYGYSRYSFPFGLAPIEGRIWDGAPRRGDVVVFKLPRDNATDYIKRVVGLPGDEVQMIEGVLHINGTAVPRERVDDYVERDSAGNEISVTQYRETLSNGTSYYTLDIDENGAGDNTQVYEVPPRHYFMMGDNRDNSADSRILTMVGYVPHENLIGRAEVIFFSIQDDARPWMVWNWPWTVRWNRLFETF